MNTMKIFIVIISISAAVFSPCCAAQTDAPDESSVRQAIGTIFADPFSPKAAEAQKTVIDFSQGSDKVKVVVARDLGFYPGSKYSDMLLGYYIAAVVRFGLNSPAKATDEKLGIKEGLKALVKLYKEIRVKDPSYTSQALEEASASLANGTIDDFISRALAQARKDMSSAG